MIFLSSKRLAQTHEALDPFLASKNEDLGKYRAFKNRTQSEFGSLIILQLCFASREFLEWSKTQTILTLRKAHGFPTYPMDLAFLIFLPPLKAHNHSIKVITCGKWEFKNVHREGLISTSFPAWDKRFCFQPWSFPMTLPLMYPSAWRLERLQIEEMSRYNLGSQIDGIPRIVESSPSKPLGKLAPKKMLDFCMLIVVWM